MPLLFVLVWATGFIVARLVAPHAEPLTFLVMRFVLTTSVFTAVAFVAHAEKLVGLAQRARRRRADPGRLFSVAPSGRHGMPAGISALIGGLQPLLTVLLSFPLLGERVRTPYPIQLDRIRL
jgi:drug/metabolite transporter (DMT)-like permease